MSAKWTQHFAKMAKDQESRSVQFMYMWLSYLLEIADSDGAAAVVSEIRDMQADLCLMYPDELEKHNG